MPFMSFFYIKIFYGLHKNPKYPEIKKYIYGYVISLTFKHLITAKSIEKKMTQKSENSNFLQSAGGSSPWEVRFASGERYPDHVITVFVKRALNLEIGSF